MIIKPKVRGFVCVTAHPLGCAAHVQEQIAYVQQQRPIQNGPKNVLIVGCSTGYGLSSRIAAAFGSNANTIGVCFERPANNGRPASAGWYNTAALHKAAKKQGLKAHTINGDAFSHEIKQATIDAIKSASMGPIDLVIYSLASPRRVDPDTQEVYKSVLKPVGQRFKAKTVNTDKDEVHEVEIEPASEEDIHATRKVMGGEDFKLWIDALDANDLLADGVSALAYSYIGPEVTWPIYKNGTIGLAKEDVEQATQEVDQKLKAKGGRAFVSVNKAVVTQASSAIPVVPLYNSILFKVLRSKNLDEGCIEQIYRLLTDKFYHAKGPIPVDEKGRIRLDDRELLEDVQKEVQAIWPKIDTENLKELTDYNHYQSEFLRLFGFNISGVDYETEVEIEVPIEND